MGRTSLNDVLSEIQEDLNLKLNKKIQKASVAEKKSEAVVSKTPVVAGRKPRNISEKNHKLFQKLCVSHNDKLAQIERIKKEVGDLKDRVGAFCMRYGVGVREDDKAFYSHPYKAQVAVIRAAGSINPEPIRKWANKNNRPDLFIQEDICKLDVNALQLMIRNQVADKDLQKVLETSLETLIKLARTQEGILEESRENYLDLEKYDEVKAQKILPESVIQKAELDMQTSTRVMIHTIKSAEDRCPGCSVKLPKKRHLNYVCRTCGTKS